MIGYILLSCTVIIWIILVALSADLVKYRKGALLGVSIPEAHRNDDAVTGILEKYKRRRKIRIMISGLSMLPLLIPTVYFSLTFSYFMFWVIVVPICDVLGYVKYEMALRNLKKEGAWSTSQANVAYVDTKLAMSPDYRMPSVVHWIVLLGLSAIPLAKTVEMTRAVSFGLVAISFVLVVLGYVIASHVCKMSHKLYCISTEVNFELNQAARKAWLKTILGLLYLTVIGNGVLSLLAVGFMNQWSWLFVVITTGLSTAPAVVILAVHSKLQKQINQALLNFAPLEMEDETSWYFGVLYHNPRVQKTFVNKRYGIGSTVNLATAGGKWFMGLTVILCIGLIIPLWISIVLDDFIPCRGVADETALRITGSMYSVEIPYEDIKSLEWTDAVKGGYKTNGSATGLYMRGNFIVPDRGDCLLFVYNDSKPYLVIERQSGEPVIYSGQTYDETKALFETLEQKMD